MLYEQKKAEMEENRNFILIPWDFTDIAENALLHGLKICKMVDLAIVLLHIVDKKLPAAEKNELQEKLDAVATKYGKEHRAEIEGRIYQGSIFSDISKYANDHEASLVIMGTHGMKGMQKLTGSWALKVIVGSKIPFIVVQDKPTDWEKYKNIVLPVDFRSESKEKLQWAIYMGKYFDSKVHILKQKITDKSLLRKTNINLNFAVRFLIQNGIEYEIHEMPKSGNFAKECLVFAQDMNADLILITTTKNITMASYVLAASEQYIIANSSKIPVLVINPKASYAKVAQFMYG